MINDKSDSEKIFEIVLRYKDKQIEKNRRFVLND